MGHLGGNFGFFGTFFKKKWHFWCENGPAQVFKYNFESIDILEMKYAETQNMSLLDKVNIIKTTGVTS